MSETNAKRSKSLKTFGLTVLVVLAGAAAAVRHLDEIASTWNKYFGKSSDLEPLSGPINQPLPLQSSSSGVQLELVQFPEDQDRDEQIYDVYLKNDTVEDVLLAEVFYASGYMYASALFNAHGSQPVVPNHSYIVRVAGTDGRSAALSPPYLLKAGSRGALRLRFQAGSPGSASGTLAFDLVDSRGMKVATVNRMLGR